MVENICSMMDSEKKGSKILFKAGLMADIVHAFHSLLDINIEQYSLHIKLIRVTAWFL